MEKKTVKKNIDISKVSISAVRFSMKESDFIEWCKKHGFTGKVSECWKKNQKESGKVEKATK